MKNKKSNFLSPRKFDDRKDAKSVSEQCNQFDGPISPAMSTAPTSVPMHQAFSDRWAAATSEYAPDADPTVACSPLLDVQTKTSEPDTNQVKKNC
ncbi:unnamed protein product [Lactuca virosa]|uniref:Uncharacterized protein n=1 Tax=Lactuca virosa TaxID=75947 RepID=A0AAU9LJQ3_9ASTR|nr:unnamed protein product [Lactuca virosa]